MNKIIKCLEDNNIKYTKSLSGKLLIIKIGNYTLEIVKDDRMFITQKYKDNEECSPLMKKDLNYTLRLIKHEIRRNNGEYSRI